MNLPASVADIRLGGKSKAGYEVKVREWQHSISAGDKRQQYYIDVTAKSTESVTALVNAIRAAFQER